MEWCQCHRCSISWYGGIKKSDSREVSDFLLNWATTLVGGIQGVEDVDRERS